MCYVRVYDGSMFSFWLIFLVDFGCTSLSLLSCACGVALRAAPLDFIQLYYVSLLDGSMFLFWLIFLVDFGCTSLYSYHYCHNSLIAASIMYVHMHVYQSYMTIVYM
jgi:hypothetical protein